MGNTQAIRRRHQSSPVHPHVRGEYTFHEISRPSRFGSSPRAWGILGNYASSVLQIRFIPTCVGNTSGYAGAYCHPSVHPHVRGEYVAPPFSGRHGAGSSPRAWGIPRIVQFFAVLRRFIPTCVGNTQCDRGTGHQTAVHPHVRGEYGPAHGGKRAGHGSSPRAWGIRRSRPHSCCRCRFIPTCVGNTMDAAALTWQQKVHPHVRGEYLATWCSGHDTRGSSPRAWGIQFFVCLLVRPSRFIPTCVGNTLRSRRIMSSRTGSSPRAWGIQRVAGNDLVPHRFIPTCVGNTTTISALLKTATVHPHVRGEYLLSRVSTLLYPGSSPRAWGIPSLLSDERKPTRFIPTCVGNTCGLVRLPVPRPVHPHVRGEYRGAIHAHGFDDGSSPRAWGIQHCRLS